MQQFFIYLVMAILLGLTACEAPNSTVEEEPEDYQLSKEMGAYYEIVTAKHDTAMLLMGAIERTQRALRGTLAEQEEEQKAPTLEVLTALEKAKEGMMTWMHEFKSTELNEEEYKALSEVEIKAYLEEEERKIEQVHVDMSTSIAEGQALLEQQAP